MKRKLTHPRVIAAVSLVLVTSALFSHQACTQKFRFMGGGFGLGSESIVQNSRSQLTHKKARFTLISEELVRLEYSEDGKTFFS